MTSKRCYLSLLSLFYDLVRPKVKELFIDECRKCDTIADKVGKISLDTVGETYKSYQRGSLDKAIKEERYADIFYMLSLTNSLEMLEEGTKEKSDCKTIWNELLNIKEKITLTKYETYFQKIKEFLINFEVDQLEIEKYHIQLTYSRSVYWLLEKYLRPVVLNKLGSTAQPGDATESKETATSAEETTASEGTTTLKYTDTLRDVYKLVSNSECEMEEEFKLFKELFEKIDNGTKIEDKYADYVHEITESYNKSFPNFYKIDLIGSLNMKNVEDDKRMKELISHMQHVMLSFLPVDSMENEKLLQKLEPDPKSESDKKPDKKLFSEIFVNEIRTKFKDNNKELLVDSSLIFKIIEHYYLGNIEEKKVKEKWKTLKRVRYEIIMKFGTWKSPTSVEYNNLKGKLQKACQRCKGETCRSELNIKPTTYYYEILTQSIICKVTEDECKEVTEDKYEEVTKDEYCFWKKKGCQDALHKWFKGSCDLIPESKDFGMFKIFYLWENYFSMPKWRHHGYKSIIPASMTFNSYLNNIHYMNDIRNKIIKKALRSNDEDMDLKSLKELFSPLELLYFPPDGIENLLGIKQLFSYSIEELLCFAPDGPENRISEIPEYIRKIMERVYKNKVNQTIRLITLSHGEVIPSTTTAVSRNVNSVTLYAPWGCTVTVKAAAYIMTRLANQNLQQADATFMEFTFEGTQHSINDYTIPEPRPVNRIEKFNKIPGRSISRNPLPDVLLSAVTEKETKLFKEAVSIIKNSKNKFDPLSTNDIFFDIIDRIKREIKLSELVTFLSKLLDDIPDVKDNTFELHTICCLSNGKNPVTLPVEQYYSSDNGMTLEMNTTRSSDPQRNDPQRNANPTLLDRDLETCYKCQFLKERISFYQK